MHTYFCIHTLHRNMNMNVQDDKNDVINYVCSLGTLCHSAMFLKNINKKKCSYPFDWIFSNPEMITECIETNFKHFINKSYYINYTPNKCGHSLYHKEMFRHHNPLINNEHYSYYIRCIIRFKQLLQKKEKKLFVIMSVNNENKDKEQVFENKIERLNEILYKHTNNFHIFSIYHIKNNKSNYHNIKEKNNICYLELNTITESDGVSFKSNEDNMYFNNIFTELYNVDLLVV